MCGCHQREVGQLAGPVGQDPSGEVTTRIDSDIMYGIYHRRQPHTCTSKYNVTKEKTSSLASLPNLFDPAAKLFVDLRQDVPKSTRKKTTTSAPSKHHHQAQHSVNTKRSMICSPFSHFLSPSLSFSSNVRNRTDPPPPPPSPFPAALSFAAPAAAAAAAPPAAGTALAGGETLLAAAAATAAAAAAFAEDDAPRESTPPCEPDRL